MLRRACASLPAARSPAAASLARAALPLAPRRPSRRGSATMAFLSSKNEALCGMSRRWVQVWGGAATQGMEAAKKELGEMMAENAVFEGDGLVYPHDAKGRGAILAALEHAHAANQHVTYLPVAVAADDAVGLAFVGVAWEFKCRKSGSPSRGFSIKQLQFSEDGKLTRSRVNRQLTADEQGRLLAPGVECQPADVFADLLPLLGEGAQAASAKPVADSEAAARMAANLEAWVGCWSSDTPDVEQTLQRVLSPDLVAYDAYGLHAGKKKQQGGPDKAAAVSMAGREGATAAIAGLHARFRDRNRLLARAVNPDMCVAFDFWRGEATGRDSEASFVVEGVDMLLFDDEQRIARLVQFDMQDYSRMLASHDAAPAGSHGDAA